LNTTRANNNNNSIIAMNSCDKYIRVIIMKIVPLLFVMRR
jgi:hypothetical protein